MAIRPLDDDDDAAVTTAALRSSRMNTFAMSATPELAKRIGANAAVARGLNGGAALALAKGGVGPDHPLMPKVARAAAKNKAKKGLGWHSFGEAVSTIGGAAGDVVEDVGSAVGTAAKTTTRVGTLVLSAPLEEAQGLYRAGYKTIADGGSLGRNLSQAGGSSLRLAIGDLMEGKMPDLGTGLFVGHKEGELGAEQERLARRLKVNGQWISLGRSIATVISEPGTKPYQIMSGLIDGAVAIAGDPAAHGLGKLAKAQKARKAFLATEAGLLKGRRPMVLEEVTDQWLTGPTGSKVLNYGAETTDAYEIWRTFGRKVPVAMVRQIAHATSPDEVRDIIKSGVLEGKLRNKPTLEVRRSFDNVRMLQTMPGRAVDPSDPDAVVRQMESFMRNAKLPAETIKARLNSIIERSGEETRTAMFDEVNATMGDTFVGIKAAVDGKVEGATSLARRLTKMWSNYSDTLAKYYTDDIGNNAPILGAVLDGNDLPLPTPHLITEYINGAIPLPDARAIRRVTSRYGRLMDRPGLDWGVAALDWMSNDVWKPMVLLRGAWTVRVIAEEQVRMASAGLDSVFRHPISALAYVAGSPNSRLAKVVDALPGVDPRSATGIGQRAFDESVEEFQSALSVRGGGWRDRVTVIGKRPVRRDEDGYTKFWADELLKIENDPIGRRVLRGLEPGDGVANPRPGLDGVKDWFWEGTGSKFRKELGAGPRRGAILTDRQVADDYIDTVFQRLQTKTTDDPELLEFLRTGKIRGDGRVASEELLAKLDEMNAAGRAPRTVVGDIELSVRQGQGAKAAAGLDRAVDAMFNALMSKPTNTLSRSPAFKQFYWRRVEEMIGQADEAGRAAILADAKAANLSRKQLARLEAKQAVGDLTPDEIDLIAKGFAVDSTKGLLYDLSQRSQFFDITRLLFPFGEAFAEIIKTWSRVGFTEGGGKPFRRAQQTIEGARGAGFFYCVDDQTEALTRRGWMSHDDLKPDDEFLTLDPQSDRILWARAERVSRFAFDGELTRWANGRIDALTTSTHRWLVEDWREFTPPKTSRRHQGAEGRRFKTTQQLSDAGYGSTGSRVVVGGGTPECFASWPVHSDEFVELIGWAITEGCYRRRPGKNDTAVIITQCPVANPANVERLRMLAKHYRDFGATCSEYRSGTGTVKAFYFGKGVGTLIRAAAPGKQITPEFLCSLTADQALLLMEILIAGDGYERSNGFRAWAQKDAGRIAGFQMLASMLGGRTNARVAESGVTNITVYQGRYTQLSRSVPTAEPYVGTVWCPTISTGTWLARRNGTTYWTGNTDPQTGEEVFNYPGSGILNNALIGVPVPFQGRVGGLNLVGSSVLPGLGPIVQIPASKLIPNKPEWDWLKEIVVPFGEPNFKQGVLESQLPAWVQKLRTFNDDPESDRLFANTVTDLMRYLRSMGEYTNSEEDQDRLEADAISKARRLYVIRAAAQWVSPTAPKPVAIAKVPEKAAAALRKAHPELFDGDRLFNPALATRTVMADLVLADFREMSDRDYDTAPFAFMDKYGEGALLFMQPKSRSVVGGLPVTKVGNDWVRANRDVVKRYPLIYGFFAPPGDPDDFDIAAYNRQLESGEREPLTPHEVLRLASSRVGAMLYDQAKLKAGTTRAGQEWLSTVRAAIAEEYPGFGEKLGLAERAKFPQVLEQLEEAAADEKILETDAGKGLALYLAARQKALAQLPSISTKGRPIKGIGSAKAARPIREWLRQVAAAIGEEHPDFAPLFEQSLSREFTADDRAEEL